MIYGLIITAIVCLMYGKTLKYGFCIDDFQIAKDSVGKEPPKNFWVRFYLAWQGIYYKNPILAHVITFFLHLSNSLLIYYAFGHNQIAFFTALLFAIHPAGTQGSVWLSGKGYSTAVFFILLMYAFKWLSPIFYWCAFTYGGFSAAVAPGVFMISWWPLLFMIPLMGILKRNRISTALGAKWNITPPETRSPSFIRLILYLKSLGYYTCLALCPTRLGVYHDYLYTYGLTKEDTRKWHKPDLFAVVGLVMINLLGWCLIYHWTSPITFGLWWFILFVSQWCNFPTTLQQAIAERYLILPLIGMMYAVVNFAYILPDPFKTIILVTFIAGFIMRVYIHIPSYRNIYFQIDHNLVNFPECYALWTWKGQEEKNRGAFFTAIEAWFQGWKLRKCDFRLNNNIAVLLTQVGQLDQAMDFLKIAEQNIPIDQIEAGMKYINGARNDILEMKRKMELDARKNQSRIIIPGRKK